MKYFHILLYNDHTEGINWQLLIILYHWISSDSLQYIWCPSTSTLTPPLYLDEDDMHRPYKLPKSTFIGGKEKSLPLKEIISRLENAYCGSIGQQQC